MLNPSAARAIASLALLLLGVLPSTSMPKGTAALVALGWILWMVTIYGFTMFPFSPAFPIRRFVLNSSLVFWPVLFRGSVRILMICARFLPSSFERDREWSEQDCWVQELSLLGTTRGAGGVGHGNTMAKSGYVCDYRPLIFILQHPPYHRKHEDPPSGPSYSAPEVIVPWQVNVDPGGITSPSVSWVVGWALEVGQVHRNPSKSDPAMAILFSRLVRYNVEYWGALQVRHSTLNCVGASSKPRRVEFVDWAAPDR
ncbi:hypothetical protein BDN72DRAFT_883922, partial [Pluteus cervinus]